MSFWMRLFRLAVSLYPRPFRERFGDEMLEVFASGLQEARARSRLAGFVLGEAARLPGSLADVYLWSLRSAETPSPVLSGAGGEPPGGPVTQRDSWGAALMGGLPNLLIGIISLSTVVLARIPWIRPDLNWAIQVTFLIAVGLGVAIYGSRKGWKRWSAGWLVYMYILGLGLFSNALLALLPSLSIDNWLYWTQSTLFPIILAYLLYRVARADRLRGLLAAVPLTAVPWTIFQEFVPELPRTLAWIWLSILAFGAAVLILRVKRFPLAVGLALLTPILGGLPFTYLGVYMGGTLPFSEPSPSWAEVWRQYVPFLAMTLAAVLGPQLAVRLREIGLSSAQSGGNLAYRLVLGGILLGLVTTLVTSSLLTGVPYPIRSILTATWQVGRYAAAGLYLTGFVLLIKAALENEILSASYRTGLLLAALFVLLPGVVGVLYLAIPQVMTGKFEYGWLARGLELVWVAAAAWVVKDR